MQPRRPPASRHRRPSRAVIIRRRITVFGVASLALGALIFAIVAGVSGPPRAPRRPHPPKKVTAIVPHRLDVGIRTLSFVDPSRTTYDYTSGETEAGRKVGIEIRYPTYAGSATQDNLDAPIAEHKQFPLIVFAPGYRLRPENYAALLDAWVHAGFLVAAIEFPDTTYPATEAPYAAKLPHGSPEADLYNEPGDVAFALDRLTAEASTKGSWLDGLVDEQAVAIAGHSDGGSAEAALVYDKAYRVADLPVRAVAVLSGAELGIADQYYAQPPKGPVALLVVQSATDRCTPPWQAVQLYNAIGEPKYFLELDDASHIGAYDGSQPVPYSVVEKVTVGFFDRSLGIRAIAVQQLSVAGNVPKVSSLTGGPVAATIPTPPGPSSCPAD